MHKCPICNKHLKVELGTLCGGITNKYIECPEGHYFYKEDYGETRINVGEKEFIYNYKDGYVYVRGIHEKVDKAIEKYKEGNNEKI